MKLFTNGAIKRLFLWIALILLCALALSEWALWLVYGQFAPILIWIFFPMSGAVLLAGFSYFKRQNQIIEEATFQIKHYLAGDKNARIVCDDEGELSKLFHTVNTLATVLNAYAEKEIRAKEFLKSTISDISHQLKTPLSALNIYNDLVQREAEELPAIKEFAHLSEQELDRIDALVQSLLKITRLDAGSIVMEKIPENVADMMSDIEHYFSYRAKQERKELRFSGTDSVQFICDRQWMIEAISNLVKKMQAYMREHYAEDITLQKLAEQFFLHPIYLSKLFKEKTGENFIDYLTLIRMENAKKLLQETTLKVYDISNMIGYESSKYFSKIFREETGKTPSEFREMPIS